MFVQRKMSANAFSGWNVCRTFVKFVYVMMRGEYYAPPPPKPKVAEKKSRKRAPVVEKAPIADLLPDDNGVPAAVDVFGFGLAVKKESNDVDELEAQ